MLAQDAPKQDSGEQSPRALNAAVTHGLATLGLKGHLNSAEALAKGLPLTEPKLYFEGVPASVAVKTVQAYFQSVGGTQVELTSDADSQVGLRGSVVFPTTHAAECAFATLHGTYVKMLHGVLYLSPLSTVNPYKQGSELQHPKLIVRHLPRSADNPSLFDLFRPLGPLFACKISVTDGGASRGFAIVQYVDPVHSDQAITQLNYIEYRDNNISVGPFLAKDQRKLTPHGGGQHRTPSRGKEAVPKPEFLATTSPTYLGRSPKSPPVRQETTAPLRGSAPTTPVQIKGASGSHSLHPKSGSPAGAGRDECKVFVKGLHINVSHSELFKAFKPYGYIYSAKVNIDEVTRTSRGTGVVVFANPLDVTKAIAALDGQELLGRPMALMPFDSELVGGPVTPKSPSSVSTPTKSKPAVTGASSPLATTASAQTSPSKDAVLNRTFLSNLSQTARDEILNAQLISQMSTNPAISLTDAPAIVNLLLQHSLDDVLRMLAAKSFLESKVREARATLHGSKGGKKSGKPKSNSPTKSVDSIAQTTDGSTDANAQAAVSEAKPVPHAQSGDEQLTADIPAQDLEKDPKLELFIEMLLEKPVNERKQKLGSKLFPLVKALGTSEATKITVWLLDHKDDVRSLAYCIKYLDRLQAVVDEAQAALGIQA
ncbi:hypothetical protein H4R34_000024 [Dimargaris verticillata]|uniref:RRM domain-containing protein n=1 Tax=Dimargaris verticillata TaxID=2761393 RepID=A0A9W8B7R6_9FUNG|nr:hypothetical protein H4R34_000024 [Dimargaris verticillata]